MTHIISHNTTYTYSKYSTRPNCIYTTLYNNEKSIYNCSIIKTDTKHLFQAKELLCWGSDLSFLNLRITFSNILKALQICWSAVRNNKKILFVNDDSSIDASTLINAWLAQQYKREAMPRKLSNLLKTSIKKPTVAQTPNLNKLKDIKNKRVVINGLFNLYRFLNTSLRKVKFKKAPIQPITKPITPRNAYTVGTSAFIPNHSLPFAFQGGGHPLLLQKKTKESNPPKRKPNGLKTAFLVSEARSDQKGEPQKDFIQEKLQNPQNPNLSMRIVSCERLVPFILQSNNPRITKSSPEGNYDIREVNCSKKNRSEKKYILFEKETKNKPFLSFEKRPSEAGNNYLKIKAVNALKLQVKETQIISEQTASEITTPLIGFLTNPKTSFGTIQNELNYNFVDLFPVPFVNAMGITPKNSVSTFIEKPAQQPCKEETKELLKLGLTPNQGSNWKASAYNQYYTPFSLNTSLYNKTISNLYKEQLQQSKQNMLVLGNIFAWRQKSQDPSSLYYSKDRPRKNYTRQQKDATNTVICPPFGGQFFHKQIRLFKNKLDFFKPKQQNQLLKMRNRCSGVHIWFRAKKSSVSKNKKALKEFCRIAGYFWQTRTVPSFEKVEGDNKPIKKDFSTKKKREAPQFNVSHTYLIPIKKKSFRKNLYTKRFYENPLALDNNPWGVAYNRSKTQVPKTNTAVKNTKISDSHYNKKQISKLLKKKSSIQLKNYISTSKPLKNYYGKLVTSNQLKQYQMFAKSPYSNNQLADIIFFINPEKNQNLVNQANSLKIPSIGIVSGATSKQFGRHHGNNSSFSDLVNYPILGNAASPFFIYTIIGLFVKVVRLS